MSPLRLRESSLCHLPSVTLGLRRGRSRTPAARPGTNGRRRGHGSSAKDPYRGFPARRYVWKAMPVPVVRAFASSRAAGTVPGQKSRPGACMTPSA
jgi:hypothetical protein